MCGIVGYVGRRQALGILLDGLQRMEYRGYDSAGVVVQNGHGLISEKVTGKVVELRARIGDRPFHGESGLGHTRWATHGGVNKANAHPHFSCDGKIAVVHNGIVENYAELRRGLQDHRFSSVTDTEVIPHLIEERYEKLGGDLLRSVMLTLKQIRGSFAVGVMTAHQPGLLVAARVNCPLVVGLGKGENFLASDISALLPHTRRVVPLEEGEIVELDGTGIQLFDEDLRPKDRKALDIDWKSDRILKGGYPDFMLKEIHEQSGTMALEIRGRTEELRDLSIPREIRRVTIVGCGTAWHAGLVGKSAIEEMAHLPVEVGFGSELRHGDHPFGKDTLTIALSQSGETADTLGAVRVAQKAGSPVLAITNTKGSTLAREADQVLFMRAGIEVGVAATKTYSSQVMNIILLSLELARRRKTLTGSRYQELLRLARRIPSQMKGILRRSSEIRDWAGRLSRGRSFMYLGRYYNLATAYEGALKMKEIAYLHSEGYGAGEMKHGPLALVDKKLACIAIAPQGRVTEKMVSNIQEVRARGGEVFSIATKGQRLIGPVSDHLFEIPACPEMFSPLLTVLPLQLLAYFVATELGRDVDRPRNLAKSVTVE
jgi:glucosamine--fructose-6-phosphate aminotransferase (isomerizing)